MNGKSLFTIIMGSSLGVLGSSEVSKAQEQTQQSVTETLNYSDKFDKLIEEEIQRSLPPVMTLPEDELFLKQAGLMTIARDYIVFRGYDSSFMKFSYTKSVLRLALLAGSDIYALLPQGLDTVLDEIQRELDGEIHNGVGDIKILRTSKPLKRGYILAGDWFFACWDSEKPAAYHDNEYLRAYTRKMGMGVNHLFGKAFLIETKQDSVYSEIPNSQGEPLFPRLWYFK